MGEKLKPDPSALSSKSTTHMDVPSFPSLHNSLFVFVFVWVCVVFDVPNRSDTCHFINDRDIKSVTELP